MNKEIKNNDVVLGHDKYSKTDVIIPYEDRFVHTLITGTNKENIDKNTLIPMIKQDLKNKEIGVSVFDINESFIGEIIDTCKDINREILVINPLRPGNISINPLFGDECDVIEAIIDVFKVMDCNISEMSSIVGKDLLIKSIKVAKRLKGDNATLLDINALLSNRNKSGEQLIYDFMNMDSKVSEEIEENERIARWFLDKYYSVENSKKGSINVFNATIALRRQIERFIDNKYVKEIMIPDNNYNKSIVNFDNVLENGTALMVINQEKELGDVGKYIGYFIMEQFQRAICRRPGNYENRKANMIYINKINSFVTPITENLLITGRTYRVAFHLTAESIECIAVGNCDDSMGIVEYCNIKTEKSFREQIIANTRNKIIYPGSNEDAMYHERHLTNMLNSYKEKDGLLNKILSKSKYKYTCEDFSASAILNRKEDEYTAIVVNSNSMQRPVVVKSR